MKRYHKILVGGVALLFILAGCAALSVKSVPLTKPVHCKAIDKTFIIPGEFPDPYNEKEMEGFYWEGFPFTLRLYMVFYYKGDDNGELIEGEPQYIMVFDTWMNEIVSVCLYTDLETSRYWIYKDLKNPTECTAEEQEEWLTNYESNNLES